MELLLNTEQEQAVLHLYGPCVVTAVPGSGKTRTLTTRVMRLIQVHHVDPGHILCLTFTNKAANEMRDRLAASLSERISDKLWISTFHRLCLATLRKYSTFVDLQPGFSVYDDKDQIELIRKIARMHEYECQKWVIKDIAKVTNDVRENLDTFQSDAQGLGVGKDRDPKTELAIANEYLSTLDGFNAVDFSGILYKTWCLFRRKPASAEALSNKFKFVLVDEGQDTNTIQYSIVKQIAQHGNLFVVGDYDQSVFSWRGARPENLHKLTEDFEDVRKIVLSRNYRSTDHILRVSQRLIRHNDNARGVVLIAERGDGAQPVLSAFPYPEREAQVTASRITSYQQRYGLKWSDIAVVYRTNQQSKLPEMVMRQHGIPYKILGGFSFFDRREVKDTLAYLSLIANPLDTISFARAVSEPKRKIGDVLIGKLERKCQVDEIGILEAAKRVDEIKGATVAAKKNLFAFVESVEKYREQEQEGQSIGNIASGLLKDTGYYDHMVEQSSADDVTRRRIDNIDELLISVADFAIGRKNAKLADYLQSIKMFGDRDSKDSEECVTLMTMHSAKGSEYKVVFIIGAEMNIIPHSLALRDRNEAALAEERRLMYVAATRAKDHLLVSFCKNRPVFWKGETRNRASKPSPFLSEMFGDFDPERV